MEFRIPPPICGNLIISNRRSVPESNLSNLSASATPGASIPVRKPPREDISGASASARISSSSSSRNVGKLPTYALDARPLELHMGVRSKGDARRKGLGGGVTWGEEGSGDFRNSAAIGSWSSMSKRSHSRGSSSGGRVLEDILDTRAHVDDFLILN
jgi:hypothetical protein